MLLAYKIVSHNDFCEFHPWSWNWHIRFTSPPLVAAVYCGRWFVNSSMLVVWAFLKCLWGLHFILLYMTNFTHIPRNISFFLNKSTYWKVFVRWGHCYFILWFSKWKYVIIKDSFVKMKSIIFLALQRWGGGCLRVLHWLTHPTEQCTCCLSTHGLHLLLQLYTDCWHPPSPY